MPNGRIHFHLKRNTKRFFQGAVLLILVCMTTSSKAPTTLQSILDRGVLRVATLQGSTTYFETAKGPAGFEYFLCKAFADSLGIKLEMTPFKSLGGLLVAIGGPKADFAAAGLTVTPDRQGKVRFSQPYDHVTQKLIYRMGSRKPRKIEDLYGKNLVVIAGSSHAQNLARLKQDYPELTWKESQEAEMLELMEQVHKGAIDNTVVDSNAYMVDRSLYPKALAAMDISEPEPLAWAFPKFGDGTLLELANAFIEEFEASGELKKLKQRYLGYIDKFDYAGSELFMSRIDSRLETYKPMFLETAEKYDLDWQLLAAIAYQESHWEPRAVSPTGVKGLMMLTLGAAKEMKVKNRYDPQQSLDGGARYFLKTKQKIPPDITEPDRTWLALASYNIGYGHLEDARVLTERGGKNPDLWRDVREFLPLLQKEKYFSTVKHGYARGYEPVRYVQNIRRYQSILRWYHLESERRNFQQDGNLSPNMEKWFNQIPRTL